MNIHLFYDTTENLQTTEPSLSHLDYRALHTHDMTDATPFVDDSDVVVFSVSTINDSILKKIERLQHLAPLVMFSKDSQEEHIHQATCAGVDAYILKAHSPEQLVTLFHAAIARFRQKSALLKRVQTLETQLSDRKDIAKATGLIMQHKKIAENLAYQTLRKMAMDSCKNIGDVAREINSLNRFQ